MPIHVHGASPVARLVKQCACDAGDGLIPGLGRSPDEGIGYPLQHAWASLVAQTVKNLPPVQPGFDLWTGTIPWRRAWQPTPVFLLGESPWTEEPGGYIAKSQIQLSN